MGRRLLRDAGDLRRAPISVRGHPVDTLVPDIPGVHWVTVEEPREANKRAYAGPLVREPARGRESPLMGATSRRLYSCDDHLDL
jgi:hypothetical protein